MDLASRQNYDYLAVAKMGRDRTLSHSGKTICLLEAVELGVSARWLLGNEVSVPAAAQ